MSRTRRRRNMTLQRGVALQHYIFDMLARAEQGIWVDAIRSAAFQENTAETPAAIGEAVGYRADLSGYGNHLRQSSASLRPTRRVASDEYDGSVDMLVATNIAAFQGLTAFTLWFVVDLDSFGELNLGKLAEKTSEWQYGIDATNAHALGMMNLLKNRGTTNATARSTTSIPLNTLVAVGARYENNVVDLFIGPREVGYYQQITGVGTTPSNTNNVYFGNVAAASLATDGDMRYYLFLPGYAASDAEFRALAELSGAVNSYFDTLLLGDSKVATAETGLYFNYWASTAKADSDICHVQKLAAGGWTIEALLTSIQGGSLTNYPYPPRNIFIDIGVNDLSSLGTQAAIEADLLAIYDAITAQWANVTIYVDKPYRGDGYSTEMTTLNGYIDNTVAARSNVNAGVDESTVFPGFLQGDNVHPTTALNGGYDRLAEARVDLLGL